MQLTDEFVMTENGPFHAAGTRIFREANGRPDKRLPPIAVSIQCRHGTRRK